MPVRLVFRNLLKHKVRTLLTVASLAVAVFLLCVLRSLVVSLDAGVRSAVSDRMIVQSAVSLFVNLPQSYVPKLQGVEGVQRVSRLQWFGGYYQDPANQFYAQFAIDPEEFLAMYPEFRVVEGSVERFLSERRACMIGRKFADAFGFDVGDSLPVVGTIFQRTSGEPWEFQVAAIYELDALVWDETTTFFQFDYLEESLEAGGASGPRGAGVIYVHLAPGADGVDVAAEIDGMFDNGPQRVQTTTESEFNAQFVSMIGNIPFFVSTIGAGVLAAIVLAVLNTMLLAGREQTRDVGVLKALGFQDGAVSAVLLAQSVVLCALGGGIGIGLALATTPAMTSVLGTMFPGYQVTGGILAGAAALSLGIGLVAGAIPAMRARGLLAVDALRRGA